MCGVVRVCQIPDFEIFGNLPEEWVPGGIIILARETKIAEMKLSEPYKNDFQFSKKSVQPKLKIFEWEIGGNLKKSGKNQYFHKNSI